MDREKATTHGGYDLQVENGGFRARKKACKDRVKTALAQKKQKCKGENSLAAGSVWLPLWQLRIADWGLASKEHRSGFRQKAAIGVSTAGQGEWDAKSAALCRAPLRLLRAESGTNPA